MNLYDPNAMLSQHYALKHLTATNQSLLEPNLPQDIDQFQNLTELADFIELIETEIGPVQILSAFRTKELQVALAAAGDPTAAGTSFHELGRGADIYPTTMPIDEYFGRMLANINVKGRLAEIAYKPGQNSIHFGINVPGDIRDTKVLSLNDQKTYGRLSLDEITAFIAPYMESATAAYDYAAAQLVTWNKTPLILGMVAACGSALFLIFGMKPKTAKNPRKKNPNGKLDKKLAETTDISELVKKLYAKRDPDALKVHKAYNDSIKKKNPHERPPGAKYAPKARFAGNPKVVLKPVVRGQLTHLSKKALVKILQRYGTKPGIRLTVQQWAMAEGAIAELERRGVTVRNRKWKK